MAIYRVPAHDPARTTQPQSQVLGPVASNAQTIDIPTADLTLTGVAPGVAVIPPADSTELVTLHHRRATNVAARFRPLPVRPAGPWNRSLRGRYLATPRPAQAPIRSIDNFNRANGDLGSNWRSLVPQAFTPVIVSNETTVTTATTAGAIWRPNTFGAPLLTEATVRAGDGDFTAALVLNSDGTLDNCSVAQWVVSGGVAQYIIGSIVNGSFTQRGLGVGAPTTGTLRLTFEDASGILKLYADGSLVVTSA